MRVFIHVDGIRCAGCANAIDQKLRALGAEKVDLDFRTFTAKIDFPFDDTPDGEMMEVISSLGYQPIYLGKELEENL